MHISWFGQTAVKLQTKHQDKDVVILIDAYKPTKGDFPRSFSPDVALFSNGTTNAATLSQNPFIMDSLGECEVKDVMIYALSAASETIVFHVNAEGLKIVHLGRLQKPLDASETEKILTPDILLIPVGGGDYLDPKAAATLATALEPRIIIPLAYQSDNDPSAKPVSAFISELGLKPETTEKKVIIKKKDLPQEETKLIVLEKE